MRYLVWVLGEQAGVLQASAPVVSGLAGFSVLLSGFLLSPPPWTKTTDLPSRLHQTRVHKHRPAFTFTLE